MDREAARKLWRQIAAKHAFAHNPEYLNEGTLDALIEFARTCAPGLGKTVPPAGSFPNAITDARSIAVAWLDAYTDTEPLQLVPDAVKQVLTVMRAYLAEGHKADDT